jgi:hypothetical protein
VARTIDKTVRDTNIVAIFFRIRFRSSAYLKSHRVTLDCLFPRLYICPQTCIHSNHFSRLSRGNSDDEYMDYNIAALICSRIRYRSIAHPITTSCHFGLPAPLLYIQSLSKHTLHSSFGVQAWLMSSLLCGRQDSGFGFYQSLFSVICRPENRIASFCRLIPLRYNQSLSNAYAQVSYCRQRMITVISSSWSARFGFGLLQNSFPVNRPSRNRIASF